MSTIRVALIQDAPVLFDLKKSIEKMETLCLNAQKGGAELVMFPEAFLGGYPRGLSFGTKIGSRSKEGREDWLLYYKACPLVDEHFHKTLGSLAKELHIYLAIGLVEKIYEGSSLYCSFLVYNPEGRLILHHRKIKPTGTERLIWAEGNGKSLTSVDSSLGKLGALICWENYMPLARYSLYQGGMDIHLAPTADSRDSWKSSMIHLALEGRCFVLSCNQFVNKSDYPNRFQKELTSEEEIMSRGGSMITSPLGEILAGPLYNQAGILEGKLDMDLIAKARLDFDAVGHYARPDLFSFRKS
ncbi:MAG: carbon-nitrogen hydrolase family protein [Bacteroidota bacterium]